MPARQQSLFEVAPPPWEMDDQAEQYVATVVFAGGPPGEFDYLVPEGFRDSNRPELLVEPGRRVQVTLGRGDRKVVGYCIEVGNKPAGGRRLKTVARVLDGRSLVSPAMLRLTRWMADYYLCPLGQVLEAVVPAGVRQQAGTREVKLLNVPTEVLARLTQLQLPAKQVAVLKLLAASSKPLTAAQLAARAGCTIAPINALRQKGLVEETIARVDSDALGHELAAVARIPAHDLNDDQQRALDAVLETLHARMHSTLLIHGVTGSGKTEVYMRAIEEVVRFGRQAIVLVPEISLTPQTVSRFRARFDRVAILHSHQSDVERHRHWQRIARGEVEVVVGPRSAVFAPTPDLGLIVLDEEHEATFKQEIAPRYHARDVARWRARAEQVPLVLGSATPSLESWQRAAQGDDRLLAMPRRISDRPLPAVHTIDLRLEEHRRMSRGAISRPLHQAMEGALADGGQVILLLNRRGFSTHMQCSACGHVLECPHCAISLTFHRSQNAARCHFCDYEVVAPEECPECRAEGIRFSGLGTQKLEAEVRARFPNATCLRMDTDSMRRPGSHDDALTTFREGRAQILLGTQMIAKGLDFPNVTLVGVVNADMALHLPDFRAAERTFQLVTQVAGRTGRGAKGGRVVVQTFSPDHPAILAAARHDYAAFAAHELPLREAAAYPPFAFLVRVVLRSEEESQAKLASDEFGRRLRATVEGRDPPVRVLGPAPAPIAKLRGCYRYHLQLHAVAADPLREAVEQVSSALKLPEGVLLTVDVDPVDML